jgi:hypothetical protein
MSVLDALRSNINNIDFDDLALKSHFSLGAAAQHCMAMNDVALQDLCARTSGLAALHAYPGLVASNIGRQYGFMRLIKPLVNCFATRPEDCAEHLLSAIADPSHSAGFFSIGTRGETLSGIPKASPEQASKVLQHLEATLAV